jgi:hypothetical protein
VATGKCTSGNKHVWAKVTGLSGVLGSKGTIKTRWGLLCCEAVEGDSSAFQVAWVGAGTSSKWAQVGYGRERASGSTTIKEYRYVEMQGDTYHNGYDHDNPPAEGDDHTYRCHLDKSTGKWYFWDGAVIFGLLEDSWWIGQTGDRVKYAGEIGNKEDDMPGTSSDRCNFTSCQYYKEGVGFQSAGFSSGSSYDTPDITEWGWEHISGTSFKIWDKHPNQ